ncbi:hypothetical protein [Bartonella sp. CB15SXKL]|uniref:hypothetical protein n=1 Tax=Bartonella sp. CB15SXKL TaxID=3243512 RepID=UPI0035CF24AD
MTDSVSLIEHGDGCYSLFIDLESKMATEVNTLYRTIAKSFFIFRRSPEITACSLFYSKSFVKRLTALSKPL